jgi:hypothetical protein
MRVLLSLQIQLSTKYRSLSERYGSNDPAMLLQLFEADDRRMKGKASNRLCPAFHHFHLCSRILCSNPTQATQAECRPDRMSVLGLASLLQGGHTWTEAENAALKASMSGSDNRGGRDWDAVAAYPGLQNRSGVCIQPRLQL